MSISNEDMNELHAREDTALLSLFRWEHLTHELLRDVSRGFSEMAYAMHAVTRPSFERTMMLRKLLEAKDCAVRAAMSPT